MTFRTVFLAIALLGTSCRVFAEDVVLVGGTIVDGTGKAGVVGNIRILSGKIDEVGPFRPRPNETTIDAKGLVIAPGFIDMDNHSTGVLDDNLGAVSQITQGITTAALGLDGEGPVLVEAAMARFDNAAHAPAFNILTFAGHNTARRLVMGQDYKRAATAAELQKMEQVLDAAMREGAFGMSANLETGPGSYASMDELSALARVVGRYGGIVVIHLRSEGKDVVDAAREAIDVGRRAKVPIHISHLKLSGVSAWGKAAALLAEIDKAKKEGIDVTADVYPYDSVESDIGALVPEEVRQNSDAVARVLESSAGPQPILILEAAGHPEFQYKSLAEIAAQTQKTPADVYLQILRDGGGRAVISSLSEKDVRSFLVHPAIVVASDAGIDYEHPRGAGTFMRILAVYVREQKLMTMENAIRKMSTLPAIRLGLKGRGGIAKGSAADLVVFDPLQVRDRATMQDPSALSEGIRFVFINGAMVVRDGQPTTARPGVALR